jgi:hypothetical protein
MLVGPTHEICQVGPIASKMTSGAELTRDEDINLAIWVGKGKPSST